jgi:chromosomal replication initiation ATPase DnaA
VKGEEWAEFRDRRGDSGRDAALYVAQRRCGMRLRELAVAAGMKDYSTVSIAVRRFERRLAGSKRDRELLRQVCRLSNVEM